MIQGAAAGRLRTMRAHNSILFRREKAPPLVFGMGDFKSFAWHGAWPQFKPTKKASYIQIDDVRCVFLDELAAGLDNIAHQHDENIIGVVTFLDLDLQKRPRLTVERRLPELIHNHFGPRIAADLRKRRPKPHTTWHLDEVYLKIDRRLVYLWRAADSEGEVLDVLVHTKRTKAAALKLMRKLLKKYGFLPENLVTDDLRSYHAPARDLWIAHRQRTGGEQPPERSLKRFDR